ncbi:hypothetical protein DFR86_07055 [Acidianus sulfidivorans JP7]|uniref:Mut7-C RNAse domain-containing protein n=1 Tax=Acidianus sulfidivorans JP7 TaxID=619593 RepID=A0A2U9IMS7_9CREN|nr:Mut7-C RNAse domain-containing protein [Acidianus sulfidivorans]AWR97331.1 hypothetical protein DFR86_07055 [Acidianus sulfidivorans JP7]
MQNSKFIVDAMLGKLAIWLRILGYDTFYSNNIEDWKILKIAENDKRIILTRDRGLYVRAKKKKLECFLVPIDYDIVDLLALLSIKYDIDLTADINASRCSECNGVLMKVNDNRWKCSKCGKEYWKGKHWRTITEILIKAEAKKEQNELSFNSRSRYGRREDSNKGSEESNKEEIRINQK